MMRSSGVVPTLTEVIELAEEPLPLDVQAPAAPEALAIEDLPVAEVMARLQPRLEAWVDLRVRAAMSTLVPAWTDAAAQAVQQELRGALPELVTQVLAELQARRR